LSFTEKPLHAAFVAVLPPAEPQKPRRDYQGQARRERYFHCPFAALAALGALVMVDVEAAVRGIAAKKPAPG